MNFEEFETRLVDANSREKVYNLAIGYLKDRPRFDWTGVYALEGSEPGEVAALRRWLGRQHRRGRAARRSRPTVA